MKTEKDWNSFAKKYRSGLKDPEKNRIIDLLAALSHDANISIGCYCEMVGKQIHSNR